MRRIALLLLASSLIAGPAEAAAEVRVVATEAIRPALERIIPAYEKWAGDRILLETYGDAELKRRLLKSGGTVDIVVATRLTLDELASSNVVDPATVQDLARPAFAVAIRSGWPYPEVSSRAQFWALLLQARAIAYDAEDPSASYLSDLLSQSGIDRRSFRLIEAHGTAMALAATGQADYAIQSLANIRRNPAVEVAGELPTSLARDMTVGTSLAMEAPNREAAASLLAFMRSATGRSAIRRTGGSPAE